MSIQCSHWPNLFFCHYSKGTNSFPKKVKHRPNKVLRMWESTNNFQHSENQALIMMLSSFVIFFSPFLLVHHIFFRVFLGLITLTKFVYTHHTNCRHIEAKLMIFYRINVRDKIFISTITVFSYLFARQLIST